MSIFGSGATLGFIDRLLFGPTHHIDYIHQTRRPDGSYDAIVYVRNETFRTTLRGSSKAPHLYERYDDASHPENVTRHELKPLTDLDDGIACGYKRIKPVNKDGHIIMANGMVYNCAEKRMLAGCDTRIMGHLVQRLRLVLLLKSILASPSNMVRLACWLTLSAIIDTGVYEVGKHMGYREAERGKIPKRLLKAADKHSPSDERMVANEILPIPLTLKPLDVSNEQFVTPTPQQIDRLNTALAQYRAPTTAASANV